MEIEDLFNICKEENPELTDVMCLIKALKEGKFSEKEVKKALKELVSSQDYAKEDKSELVKHLNKLSDA